MRDDILRATAGRGGGAVDDDDAGDGTQCSDHPYSKPASAGGICALCLQEKLGKLVSSSSTSFFTGSDVPSAAASLSFSLALRPAVAAPSSSSNSRCHQDSGYCSTTKTAHNRRVHLPYLLTQKNKLLADHHHSGLVLKRSKSTATPHRRGGNPYLSSKDDEDHCNTRQNRGGFWSFFYSSKPKSEKPTSASAGDLKPAASTSMTTIKRVASRSLSSLYSSMQSDVAPLATGASSALKRAEDVVVVEDDVSDSLESSSSNTTSFGRKVSRSRSVGCGSRRFSGDFFDRISTGFGDCSLRRVESHRDGSCSSTSAVRGGTGDVFKERVRCAGIFSGFMMTLSSSSSSSSSYGLSSSTACSAAAAAGGPLVHGRSRSWVWALPSPMRVFSKPSTKDGKTTAIKSNPAPNFSANPSLLTARGRSDDQTHLDLSK